MTTPPTIPADHPTPVDDLTPLEQAAEAATAGPYRECGHARGGCVCCIVWALSADTPVASPNLRVTCAQSRENDDFGEGFSVEQAKKNARYIALANPTAILALVAEVRELRKAAQTNQQKLADGWAKLRADKVAIRGSAWGEGYDTALADMGYEPSEAPVLRDTPNPYEAK